MCGRGRGYQLLNNDNSSERNPPVGNQVGINSESANIISSTPWKRELSPVRPLSESQQQLFEWVMRGLEEPMEDQERVHRHQVNIPETPRSPPPIEMEEQEQHLPPRLIPIAVGSPPPPDENGRQFPPTYDSLYGPPTTRRLPDFLQDHHQVQRELMALKEEVLDTQARLMAAYQQSRERILRRFY